VPAPPSSPEAKRKGKPAPGDLFDGAEGMDLEEIESADLSEMSGAETVLDHLHQAMLLFGAAAARR